jgi:formylmethanofuran dehydrogenase subunit E
MAITIIGLVVALIAVLLIRRLFNNKDTSYENQVEIICNNCGEMNWEKMLQDRLGLCFNCESDLTEFMGVAN